MVRVCVDASVAIKWLAPEPGSGSALRLLRGWLEVAELWAPDLLYVEGANAVRRKAAQGVLAPQDALETLRKLFRLPFRVLSAREIVEDALELGLAASLKVWDACYLAVARRVGAELWTADEELHSRGRRAYESVHLLRP